MNQKDSKILEIFAKYVTHNKCEFGSIEVDPYSYKPHNNRVLCMENSDYGNTIPNIIDISDVIEKILNENNSEIFDDDGEGGNLTEIRFNIFPKTRTIKVVGLFSVLKSMDEQTEYSTEELPEEIVNLFTASGITQAHIDFNGGGDSGYIEEYFKDQNGNDQRLSQFGNLEDVLLHFLDHYGDWYNNEGAQGSFTIDVPAKEMSYEVTPNDYVDEDHTFFQLKY